MQVYQAAATPRRACRCVPLSRVLKIRSKLSLFPPSSLWAHGDAAAPTAKRQRRSLAENSHLAVSDASRTVARECVTKDGGSMLSTSFLHVKGAADYRFMVSKKTTCQLSWKNLS